MSIMKNIFKVKNFTETSTMDVPKVICEDFKLQVAIGQWLGILTSQCSLEEYPHLPSERVKQQIVISEKKYEEIVATFGFLLNLVGIDNVKSCTLNQGQFDRDYFSFNCHFNDSGNDINISLGWKITTNRGKVVIINYQNESKTYEYWKGFGIEQPRLKLQHYITKKNENENIYSRYLSPYDISITLQNGEYSFSIDINRPKSIKVDNVSDDTFRLKNEEQLQQYLLGLSFPFEINEVYKRISEISLDSITEYSVLDLKVKKRLNERECKTIDRVYLNYGKLTEFTITRGEKTITIGNYGISLYDSPKLSVSKNQKGNINYSLNLESSDELLNVANPFEQYNEVNKEFEQVRKLARAMLKSEEN